MAIESGEKTTKPPFRERHPVIFTGGIGIAAGLITLMGFFEASGDTNTFRKAEQKADREIVKLNQE